ncbi:hypoxanthine phosphoribosyltransferase [bacterium]|nr:MAG: hypoxanthine phosphoribosyltransferase [bacterium]
MRMMIEEEEIKRRVKELGKTIGKYYSGKNPLVVGVLKGAFIFIADLIREMEIPCEVDFIDVKYYRGKEPRMEVRVERDIKYPVEGRNVLLVDTVLDTGETLSFLVDHFKKLGASSVEVCVLLKKRKERRKEIKPKWVGFEIPDVFVVGYGLDENESYRNARSIFQV